MKSVEAARALADRGARRIISAFVEKPTSISDAARTLKLDLRRLHYHVGKLHRLGLLRIAESVARAGRPIRLYQAVSGRFLVADELLPEVFTAELFEKMRDRLTKGHFRSGGATIVSVGESGSEIVRTYGGDAQERDVSELWLSVALAPGDLRQIELELRALFSRFDRPAEPGSRSYLLHAAAIPG